MTPEEIRALRLSLKDERGKPMSQEAFARVLGVSAYSVQRWEQGRGSPSSLALRRLKEVRDERDNANVG